MTGIEFAGLVFVCAVASLVGTYVGMKLIDLMDWFEWRRDRKR